MALNPNYMIAPSLQEYFVDKLTGQPLSGGIVSFWIDSNRSVPKNIYTLSGSPPSYSYTALPNPLTLSSVGTPQDNSGNDVIIYFYPFDVNGNVELYYVQVFDSNGAPQWTRQAWPNLVEAAPTQGGANDFNYIPNGQLLAHNNVAASSLNNFISGKISQPTTVIAPGGWQFIRPSGSTANDFIFFPRYGSYVVNPSASPRYAVEVECLGANPADTYKSLRIEFEDVNKFASDTQTYTFAFTGISNAANLTVSCNVVKNFGTGGSTQIVTTEASFVITGSETVFSVSFTFGDNAGKTIGILDDDFVAIDLQFPTNLTYDVVLTDFMLLFGTVSIAAFPTQTNRDFLSRTLTLPPPDPNGFDLGLPLLLTQSGLGYDISSVGNVSATVSSIPGYGRLLCDGSSYLTGGYSSDGIPYKRLQRILMGQTSGISPVLPLFGTGVNYISSFQENVFPNFINLSTNKAGAQTFTVDGAVPTGFLFTNVIQGNTSYGFSAYPYGNANQLWILSNAYGAPAGSNGAGTSGFTMNSTPNPNIGERVGDAYVQQLISLTVSSSLPTAGTYFRISNPTTAYYVWFTINGVGTDPAPGGTGIQVNLVSSMSPIETAYCIASGLSGFQVSNIQVNQTGSTLTPNSYFTFNSNSQLYYVWYSLNGTGTDPLVAGAIGVPVSYHNTDSANTISSNTVFSINSLFFATPDLRGMIIKGWDSSGMIDLNTALRYSRNVPLLPSSIGTYQFDYLLNHSHPILNYTFDTPPTGNELKPVGTNTTSPSAAVSGYILSSGTGQNDVKNVYLNYVIKY